MCFGVKPIFHCDAETFALGPCVGFDPQSEMLVSKTQNPTAGQWNIGCVGSQTQNSHVGHVHYFFLVTISFALGSVFQWIMGLRLGYHYKINEGLGMMSKFPTV